MLFTRMLRAAKLDSNLFRELGRDPIAPAQAIAIVIMATLATVAAFVAWSVSFADEVNVPESIARALITMPLLWLIIATSAYVVGGFVSGENKPDGKHLAVAIGFSAAPAVLNIFLVIPFVNILVGLIVPFWLVAGAASAVKSVADTTFIKGLMAAAPGFIIQIIIAINLTPSGGS